MIKQINGTSLVSDKVAKGGVLFDLGDVVTAEPATGLLIRATASTAKELCLGLINQAVTAGDDNFADNKTVGITEFHKEAEFECDVSTGTATQAMVGDFVDLDDEKGLDVTASAEDHAQIVRFIDGTKVRVKFA